MNLFLQVLLGRSTDDIDVDIDLGKEGRANKISRRQVWLCKFVLEFFFPTLYGTKGGPKSLIHGK